MELSSHLDQSDTLLLGVFRGSFPRSFVQGIIGSKKRTSVSSVLGDGRIIQF